MSSPTPGSLNIAFSADKDGAHLICTGDLSDPKLKEIRTKLENDYLLRGKVSVNVRGTKDAVIINVKLNEGKTIPDFLEYLQKVTGIKGVTHSMLGSSHIPSENNPTNKILKG